MAACPPSDDDDASRHDMSLQKYTASDWVCTQDVDPVRHAWSVHRYAG